MGLALGLLSGCATYNPYTGRKQLSDSSVGAGIGAFSGALFGSILGRGQGALIGAGVGALAGGLIGNYMDQQQAQLRRELVGSGVQVERQGNNIRLIMPRNITFSISSYKIKSSFYHTLNAVTLVFKKFKRTRILVAGYTSNTGTREFNQRLSTDRARSVANYFIAQGISRQRTRAVGYGERYPLVSNRTARGRAKNRRVEVKIMPMRSE